VSESEEDLLETPRSERADRAEAIATLAALVWVGTSAVVLAVFGGNISLIGILAIGPFIACAFARPLRVALVGGLATFFALIISTPPHSYGTLNHLLRVLTQVAATALAMWISYLRGKRNLQLWTARSETRNERRRRVAAETSQRMQAMARALTTAADPAQVADAVFAALRDELHVDAATFALVGDRGQLRTLRRFGYDPEEPIDSVLPVLRPDGPVLGQNMAFFAESLEDLRLQRADLFSMLATNRFNALAIVPMVVSAHTIGAVVVHWEHGREISEPDRNFILTITDNAAQAVERARLTVTEFVNLERSQHLHRLSSALAAATTPGDVAHAAISGARRALGAQSAVVRIPDPTAEALFCLASSGHPSLLSAGLLPLDTGHSGACFTHGGTVVKTIAEGDPVGLDLEAELMPQVLAELDRPVTVVSEPLVGSVGTLGVLSLAFVGQPEPGEPDRRFLSTLAGLTAQALERAQVFEHEREARHTAEAARERLSLLSEVTRLLSSSLEPTTVIRRTMTLVEGRLADACVVQVPGDNGLARLDVRGPRRHEEPRDGGTEEVRYDSDNPAAMAFRTGRTQLALIDDAGRPLADAVEPAAADGSAQPPGASTALAVPLTANGQVIGVMTFIDGPGRAFEEDDVSLATEVAGRAGVALSNATRFQREHVVAEVLQRSVLPEFLPEVDGLRLDAEYRAGIAGTYAGGDWYDVFPVGPDTVFFSVGDVMGKGAPAAALMGQVRSAIRAYAISGQSPAEVLTSLDSLFDALVEDRVVTAITGRITASTGHVEMSNAGHPPPLHVRAGGTANFTPMQGSLLIAAGLGGEPRAREELTLDLGDSLVMYSDGLIEHRGELITDGMDRLASAAGVIARAGWPDRPAMTFASMLTEEERTDDVVVLCLHRTAASPAADAREGISPPLLGWARDGMAVLELDPVVESTPLARHWVTAHLRDLPSEVAGCAALLTSELVTNAVLHAATPICVTLHVLTDRIRVDVADRSTAIPALKDYGRDAATGRGLTLFSTLASDWGVEETDGGKIVWFELPVDYPVPPTGVSDGSFHFDLAGITHLDGPSDTHASAEVQVRLRGIPVALLQKSSEEYEALFRELRLMKERADVSPDAPPLPERLAMLVSDLGTRFNGLGPGMDDVWQRALDEHLELFDWTLQLPKSAASACEFYDAMLDEADEFAHSARLLTLPASPASVAVRRWFLSELVRQLHGEAPLAWTDSAQHAELGPALRSR
jgi:GAF domain-containing protein/anti-sigma regulatory factor (Ser/Thr protein kinase)